ncbi:MAG: hypothetical protein QGG53_46265 [Planctomycetota bacterium]|nr:hypothetical protein [Planctomycetota bacterium]
MSNYYPSAPYSARTRLSDFKLRQTWQINRDVKTPDKHINWNDEISWLDEIEEPYRSQLPFRQTDPVFSNVPGDAILSNNAEHHGFTNSDCHILCPGSSFCSGNFDVRHHFCLQKHGFPVGFGGSWQDAFRGMIQALDHHDAGGIVIAHPTWFSKLTDDVVCEMLDFDSRVLGIEIYNDLSANRDYAGSIFTPAEHEAEPGFSLAMWDRVLSTGRCCWGFCVPDHSVRSLADWHGRIVLLVDNFTDHACLRAYRTGQFYGCLKDNGLTVTSFTATDFSITCSTNTKARIKFVTDDGRERISEGESATCRIPQKNGSPAVTFARVEIEDNSGERLFLQPVMYRTAGQRQCPTR